MSKNTTVIAPATSVSIAFPDLPDAVTARKDGQPSIRQIILTGLAEGRNTPSIAAVVAAMYPDSAAAKKASKHIAYYRSWVKKNANPYAVKA